MVDKQTYSETCPPCAEFEDGLLRMQAAQRLQVLRVGATSLRFAQEDSIALLRGMIDQQYTIEHRWS
jgi:hypothetical protein